MNNEHQPNIRSLYDQGLRPQTVPPSSNMPSRLPGKRVYFQPQPTKRERRLLKKLELPLIVAGGMIGGFLAQSIAVGLILLTIYGAIAFIARIPSRTTFTLALLLLAAISFMLLIKPNPLLIKNFASYTFVLLLIGAITLGGETKMPKRVRPKRRR